MKQLGKQKGFTIIELVVVILLLGILTATALPRFGGLTDSAHQGVVNGVFSALASSDSLFEAQWYADGQPVGTAVAGYGTLIANTDGNTTGTATADFSADPITGDETACETIYEQFVNTGAGGALVVEAVAFTTDAETTIETAATATDIVATTETGTDPTQCIYYYTGQFDEGTSTNSVDIPTITYTIATGAWVQAADTTLSTD